MTSSSTTGVELFSSNRLAFGVLCGLRRGNANAA